MHYFISIFKDFTKLRAATWAVLAVVVLAVVMLRIIAKGKHNDTKNTKRVVYGGLCIAISFVLSYIRLYHMPQGGSITPASMLPLFIYAYIYGPAAGITAGAAYGLLQLIQDAYVVHWAQLLLDYPLAFGALGLAGYFAKSLPLGIIVGGLGRFIFHFISGFVFFGSYAPKGVNPIYYSLGYNATVLAPEIAICLVVALIPQIRNAIEYVKRQI